MSTPPTLHTGAWSTLPLPITYPSRSPAVEHFDAIYRLQSNNPIKSTLVFNVLQKSATVGRTDAMDYRPCIAAWHQKLWGVRAHLDPHTGRKRWVRTPGPEDPHRIAATAPLFTTELLSQNAISSFPLYTFLYLFTSTACTRNTLDCNQSGITTVSMSIYLFTVSN